MENWHEYKKTHGGRVTGIEFLKWRGKEIKKIKRIRAFTWEYKEWSDHELNLLKANIDKTPSQIQHLFPDRGRGSIRNRLRQLRIKIAHELSQEV